MDVTIRNHCCECGSVLTDKEKEGGWRDHGSICFNCLAHCPDCHELHYECSCH